MAYKEKVGMKLSVVVPVYNTAEYLDECIRSIIHQTYKDIEEIGRAHV